MFKFTKRRRNLLAVRIARKYSTFTGSKEQLLKKLEKDPDLVGVDPATIMAMIQAIMLIIQLIQKWRENKNPSALLLTDDEILEQIDLAQPTT